MSRKSRSARGQIIDFDLLAIKAQLATTPAAVGVNQRRKFIDEKDGIRTKESVEGNPLAVAETAVDTSAKTTVKPKSK